MPGPASTVGDRPPTNPEIRVRFPPSPKQMESFSCRGRIMRDPDFPNFFSASKSSNAIYWRKVVFKSLSVWKGCCSLNKLVPLWWSEILTLQQRITQQIWWEKRICNLQQYQLTKLNLRRSTSVDWTRPRNNGRSSQKQHQVGDRKERIIGQNAGHEIPLEIEDVLDTKKVKSKK